jgi:hypothetical protein
MSRHNRRLDSSRPRSRRRPSFESLEGRQLLSLGPEFLVNTAIFNKQFEVANAKAPGGMSVAVWTDFSTNSAHLIRAQLYNQFDVKVGPELRLANTGRDDVSVTPAVAMDSTGTFVVTWTQPFPGGDTNVVAQRYRSDGTPLTGIIPVGAGIFKEHDSHVAMDGFGGFVVSYTRDTNGNNPDVFAKRYDASGNLLKVIDVATSSQAETHSSVAVSPGGGIDVAFELQFSGTDDDILLGRFTGAGVSLGRLPIATSTAREQSPSLSMDDIGNAVVAYQKFSSGDWDIKARRVSPTGSVGAELNIRNTSADETRPSVALKPGPAGGGFVVAYNRSGGVGVTEVSASGAVLANHDIGSPSEIAVGPTVRIDGSGHYLLTYTTLDALPFGSDFNVRGRFGRLS